jgi:hypothetical protein
MKFRRKSNHPDSPCPPELFPNIDLTTLCQLWHHGMLVQSLMCTVFQDGGVDEADEALLMPLHLQTTLQPAFRVPILSTSSGFGSRRKSHRSTKHRNKEIHIHLSDQAHLPTEDANSLSLQFLEARLTLFGTPSMGLFRPGHLGLKEIQLNQKQYNNEFLRCEIRDHVSRCMQRSTQHRAPITCS